jgi:hypothetical protein
MSSSVDVSDESIRLPSGAAVTPRAFHDHWS